MAGGATQSSVGQHRRRSRGPSAGSRCPCGPPRCSPVSAAGGRRRRGSCYWQGRGGRSIPGRARRPSIGSPWRPASLRSRPTRSVTPASRGSSNGVSRCRSYRGWPVTARSTSQCATPTWRPTCTPSTSGCTLRWSEAPRPRRGRVVPPTTYTRRPTATQELRRPRSGYSGGLHCMVGYEQPRSCDSSSSGSTPPRPCCRPQKGGVAHRGRDEWAALLVRLDPRRPDPEVRSGASFLERDAADAGHLGRERLLSTRDCDDGGEADEVLPVPIEAAQCDAARHRCVQRLLDCRLQGQFCTSDCETLDQLTVCDAHSRLVISCHGLPSAEQYAALRHFGRLFWEHGLSTAIRSDNGTPFATQAICGLGRLSVALLRVAGRVQRRPPPRRALRRRPGRSLHAVGAPDDGRAPQPSPPRLLRGPFRLARRGHPAREPAGLCETGAWERARRARRGRRAACGRCASSTGS